MPTPTNPDKDEKHRRRREAGQGKEAPDGREVARKLYGGLTDRESDSTDE